MRITSNEFNKLSQLDRIEYRQKLQSIKESNFVSPYVLIPFMLFLALQLILFPLYYHVFGEKVGYEIFNTLDIVIRVFLIMYIFTTIIDFMFFLKAKMLHKKLNEEYFLIKPKK